MSDSVLSCQRLSKTYSQGTLSVDVFFDIELSVASGDMVSIIGASGSGKSTLLHLLAGLDKPTSGDVSVVGQPLGALSEKAKSHLRSQHLGFVYQFHHLLQEFNALENVCLPLLIGGARVGAAKKKALSLIEKVGLQDRALHRVSELSGGERQRIAIARALVNDPQCVLADEPTGNLDQGSAQQVLDLLLTLNQELATSFVVVTHNEPLAYRMDKTYRLKKSGLEMAFSSQE